uniref:Protein SDA1 n=1 Tax=Bartheletia paradoxa TaxID=669517 RepID=A0A2D0XI00_9BASI|nr:hypothetical protein SPAR01257 [Bartheletia paradoxa]
MESQGGKANGRGILLTANLPQLQNLIKRDPKAYHEEFLQQFSHYRSMLLIFRLRPSEDLDLFSSIVGFISQVAQCYPKDTVEFPAEIASLLLEHHHQLNPDTRKSLVQNLVMLRNKEVISSIDLLKTLFPLLPLTTSAPLRSFIRTTILTDIRTANARSKNHKLNRLVQGLLFGMVERGMSAAHESSRGAAGKAAAAASTRSGSGGEAMWSVTLAKELWKKGVWNDAKTVQLVQLACEHPNAKVQSAAIHFFLGSGEGNEDDGEEDEDEGPSIGKLQHIKTINKTTRSSEKKMAKAQKAVTKKRRDKQNGVTTSVANFSALQLVHDSQSFGEKLYANLSKYDKQHSLDQKVLIMQLLSRIMGSQKLCVLGFYSYVVKYLTHHQLQITLILVSLAQSVHDLTPPDVLVPVIRKLAQEFIHPGVSSEVVAAGLNSIREICRRQPWCMEQDLLEDLVDYKKSRDKGVAAASRGILQLFRDVNPGLLRRRERGKAASMGMKDTKPLPFGHSRDAATGIDGLELLEDHLLEKEANANEAANPDAVNEWDGWDVDSEDEDSDGNGWTNVSDDDGDLIIPDSDDESGKKNKGEKEKKKTRKEIREEREREREKMDVDESEEEVVNPEEVQKAEELAQEEKKMSTLALTKILTPADFAKLNELRLQSAKSLAESGGGSAAKRKLVELEALRRANQGTTAEDTSMFVSESEILGARKKTKQDYAERMESIEKGREGRDKFGSHRGKQLGEKEHSSTNREKKRNKPIMMAVHSRDVVQKKKASMRDKQIALRKHIDKQKKSIH